MRATIDESGKLIVSVDFKSDIYPLKCFIKENPEILSLGCVEIELEGFYVPSKIKE